MHGLTVVHRNQLKDPNISHVAVKDPATLKNISKMAPSAQAPNVRPAGAKLTVQPLNGNRVMLRNSAGSGSLVPGRGTSVGSAGINRPQGQTSNSPSIKKSGGSEKAAPAKSSGSSGSSKSSSGSSGSGARKIRKQDAESPSSYDMSGAARGSSLSAAGPGAQQGPGARSIRTYPSSPSISRPQNFGDGGAGRSGSFTNRILGSPSYGGRSFGPSSSTRSSGSSTGRVSSGSSRSSGRSSTSRSSSSGSRSSSGSHSSGGGARKR